MVDVFKIPVKQIWDEVICKNSFSGKASGFVSIFFSNKYKKVVSMDKQNNFILIKYNFFFKQI